MTPFRRLFFPRRSALFSLTPAVVFLSACGNEQHQPIIIIMLSDTDTSPVCQFVKTSEWIEWNGPLRSPAKPGNSSRHFLHRHKPLILLHVSPWGTVIVCSADIGSSRVRFSCYFGNETDEFRCSCADLCHLNARTPRTQTGFAAASEVNWFRLPGVHRRRHVSTAETVHVNSFSQRFSHL